MMEESCGGARILTFGWTQPIPRSVLITHQMGHIYYAYMAFIFCPFWNLKAPATIHFHRMEKSSLGILLNFGVQWKKESYEGESMIEFAFLGEISLKFFSSTIYNKHFT